MLVNFNKTLLIQLAAISLCIVAVVRWAANFPYPSPVIKPLLPPTKRWPTAQVGGWVHTQAFPRDFLEYFARDPARVVPSGDNVVSPADGFVREMLVRDGIAYLMIQLTFWDVHVVRTPIAGIITDIEEEGMTLFKKDPEDMMFLRGKVAPVQKIVTLQTAIGKVRVRLISNYWASRIKLWVAVGQRLEKGERLGRMLAGSTVVAEFPESVRFSVAPRQRVLAGETIVSKEVGSE